ncbi:uncharacterized protein LOC131234984 [Magnolia sinica]|uniref:uncharacterized protein LOC131234984 n=1 Tax=Magnolia sinica TaxID=86752 RepID=UPI002657FAB2|nr:uncharacterized protein LOC131234984 [Magnolia sinica]
MAIGSKSNRGRPYALMLLLAFGAAVLGVMVLHKLREKRLYNILISEKDRELISLQLFLQKERDSAKEMKRKIEEMKVKAVALRTQKMGLSNKIMEMQSMIASLKGERRALESAIEERDNRIKILADKETNATEGNLQVTALTELLKQKDSEIEEMKRRLRKPTNVWSVSAGNSSKLPVNVTVVENVQVKDENMASAENATTSQDGEALAKGGEYGDKNGIEARDGLSKEPDSNQDGDSVRREGMGEKNALGGREKGEVLEEQLEKELEESQGGEGFVKMDKKGPRNVTEGNERRETSKERGDSKDGPQQKLKNSEDGEVKEPIAMPKDDYLETPKHSRKVEKQTFRTKLHNKRRKTISTGGLLKIENSRGNDNTKLKVESSDRDAALKVESGDRDAVEDESRKAIPSGEELENIRQSRDGNESAMEGLEMNNEGGTVSDNRWPEMAENSNDSEGTKMRDESGDKNSLEGSEQMVVSDDRQLEMTVKSNGKDSSMTAETADQNAVEQIKQEAVSKNGQMEIVENSQVGDKNMSEGNEKEEAVGDVQLKVPQKLGYGNDSTTIVENGDENNLEEGKESEAVSN